MAKQLNNFDNDYGILQVLASHKEDVRTVRPYPNNGLLSGSRDNTAKLYKPFDVDDPHSELSEKQIFSGPSAYVSSVFCGKTKAGDLDIYVGSHDTNIYIYRETDDKPIDTLSRHCGPVCALAFRVCDDQDVLVSGSWDNTATIWKDKIPVATLLGHVNAVWSVAFVARSFILTAGADKTIRKWKVSDGSLLNIFEGHKECVRGLAVINGQQFLSCSNDASIIMWSIDGEIMKTFEGHENFIFDICIVREPLKPNTEQPKSRPYKFVSVSEDKTVRIWNKEFGCLQKIPLQATTLWSVAALDNGNFVVGTSDGHAYVFSNVQPGQQIDVEKASTSKEC